MIYGLNFTGAPIPPDVAHQFPRRLRWHNGKLIPASDRYTAAFLLEGVCTTVRELTQMKLTADNGRRAFYTIERNGWHALYIGFAAPTVN